MRTLQQTATRISFQFIATDDNGALKQLIDAILTLISLLRIWVSIQLADPSRTRGIQVGILIDRLILLSTLMIEILSRVLKVFVFIETAIEALLDSCQICYEIVESLFVLRPVYRT